MDESPYTSKIKKYVGISAITGTLILLVFLSLNLYIIYLLKAKSAVL